MSQEVVELLRAARDKLSNPACWTQHFYARDGQGLGYTERFQTQYPEAQSWCALGAIYFFDNNSSAFNVAEALENVLDAGVIADALVAGKNPVVAFNDAPGRKHEEILALFDRAIARLESNQVKTE